MASNSHQAAGPLPPGMQIRTMPSAMPGYHPPAAAVVQNTVNGGMGAPRERTFTRQSSSYQPRSQPPQMAGQSDIASGSNNANSVDGQGGRQKILSALGHLKDTRDLLRRYNFYHDVERTGPSRGRKSILKLSCVACRETKVKCVMEEEGVGPCIKCQKRGLECVFEKHRRTQKRDAERIEDIERSLDVIHKALAELAQSSSKHSLEELEVSPAESWGHSRPSHLKKEEEYGSSGQSGSPHSFGTPQESLSITLPPNNDFTEAVSRGGSPPRWKRKLNDESTENMPQMDASSTDSDDENGIAMNPLKLLAASASAADKSDRQPAPQIEERASSPVHDKLPPRWRNTPYQQLDTKSYWRKDHFQPIPDVGEEVTSVLDAGLISEAQAERYLQSYFAGFNNELRLLDPNIHTLDYLKKHSAFLLGVICSLEARYTDGDEQIALALRKHIHETEMAQIMCAPSFKSIEIGQGFIILVAYGSTAEEAQHDRSWTFLMAALRMATELGLHLTPLQKPAPASESEARHRRNMERFWLVTWGIERILCAQTGRPSLMPKQPYEHLSVSEWHQHPYALPYDLITVANIELEMIVSHHTQLYHTLVSDATQDLAVRLQFYRDAIASELSKWKTCYATRPTPEQVQALSSARMLLCSLPIRDRWKEMPKGMTTLQFRELRNECRFAAMELVDSASSQPVERLVLATNSSIMAAVHACVLLVQFASRPFSPAMHSSHTSFRTMEKVQIFTEKLLAASKQPASRSWTSFAATYAQLLLRILSRTSTALTSAQEARAGIDGQQGGRYLPSPKPSQVFLNRSLMGRGGHPSSQPATPLLSSMSSSQQASPSAQPVAGSNPNVLPPVPSTSLIGNNGWQESHQNYAFHHQPQQHHGEPAPLGNIFGMPSPSMPPPTSSSMSWPGPDMDRNAGPPLMLENIMDQLLGASTFTQGADNESMQQYLDSLIYGNATHDRTPTMPNGFSPRGIYPPQQQ